MNTNIQKYQDFRLSRTQLYSNNKEINVPKVNLWTPTLITFKCAFNLDRSHVVDCFMGNYLNRGLVPLLSWLHVDKSEHVTIIICVDRQLTITLNFIQAMWCLCVGKLFCHCSQKICLELLRC